MDRWRWIWLLSLICLLPLCRANEIGIKSQANGLIYNHTLAKTLAEYASAVYMTDLTALYTWTCSRCNDLTKGFEVQDVIVDVQNCLQAFVGLAPNLNAIVIAIRGTQENSIQNWIKDLIWIKVDLKYPNLPGAKVHSGLFSAYNNTYLRPSIIEAVHETRKLNGNITVMVTGHSMGGAMASFCALDLAINHGIQNVQLMTFGQPRIGNAVFASYFAKYVPNTIRMTHANDIVPHLPPYFFFLPKMTYHHFPREVWLHCVNSSMVEKICDGSGEDPTCCRSVSLISWSILDHFTYLGVDMEADDWSTCRIMMDHSALPHKMDLSGNIIISKQLIDPSILQRSRQTDSSSSS